MPNNFLCYPSYSYVIKNILTIHRRNSIIYSISEVVVYKCFEIMEEVMS